MVETSKGKSNQRYHKKTIITMKSPKILVIGSKGMLGQDLIDELKKSKMNCTGYDIQEIDITKESEMSKIEKENPDVLINCAAYTNVDLAEKEREKCHAVNVIGLKNLTEVCKKNNIVLVSISTDYVFNGSEEEYNEDDTNNPINYYGKTKAEGEELITKNLDKYYLVRTSWLFGKKGKNFVETIRKLASERPEIKVVNDQTGRPTYTRDLCKGIIDLIKTKKPYGIYHITNSGKCTWFEFAKEIVRLNNSRCKVVPCTTEDFPRDAKRPRFSVLRNNKTAELPDWEDALKRYSEE